MVSLQSFLLLVKIFLNGTIFSSPCLVVKLFIKNRQGENSSSPVTVTLHGLPAAFAQIYGFILCDVTSA